MKFLILLAALLIEQVRPLRAGNVVHAAYLRYARYLQQQFDAGEYRQGVTAWVVAVAPLTLAVFALEWVLSEMNDVAAWLFSVGVLYLAVGFRQFSNYFNKINVLLSVEEVPAAREHLREWCERDCSAFDANTIARVAIEQGLVSSHRYVFAPVAWFLVFGAAGALLYRMALALQSAWHTRAAPDGGTSSEFARFALRAFDVIDWLPARVTAISFGIAGNFQDAMECWRNQAAAWADRAQGILLASGAGALGVKLGGPLDESGASGPPTFRPVLGTGDDADTDYLTSAVGLVWRTMVMWMLLILVVTVAHWIG